MIKYSVTFSTNNSGNERDELEVRKLIVQLLSSAGIDGATIAKNFAGIWKGQMEDSYMLTILSDNDITVKVKALAINLKINLMQESVMVEQCITDTQFI